MNFVLLRLDLLNSFLCQMITKTRHSFNILKYIYQKKKKNISTLCISSELELSSKNVRIVKEGMSYFRFYASVSNTQNGTQCTSLLILKFSSTNTHYKHVLIIFPQPRDLISCKNLAVSWRYDSYKKWGKRNVDEKIDCT